MPSFLFFSVEILNFPKWMDFECNAELLLIQAINFITFKLISIAALRGWFHFCLCLYCGIFDLM